MIRIHNSLSGQKQELAPIRPGHVRMYVCGITVYDHVHVGHARMFVVFDMVRRYLQRRGFAVTLVQNITDIDDKIIRRAAENGEPMEALVERFIRAMWEDRERLGIVAPDHEPRATEYLPQIISMVERLIERGYAYVASNGDVMYSVAQFEGYGRLSGKCLADLRAGARVAVVEAKRDPLDFVLWKAAKPGEPAWNSPWGSGRPGWHIECSAMSTSLLGDHFDIHGGGLDLKFPHHENEIAQSCGASGHSHFANLWMHNGFVNVDSEKMSKSLGNFFTLRDVLAKLRHPEVMRYFMLSSHYRGPINYSLEQLEQADAALVRLYTALRELPRIHEVQSGVHTERFCEAMDDDFNTPEALAVLQSLARGINSARAAGDNSQATLLGAELRSLAGVLGLAQADPEAWLRGAGEADIADSAVESLIEERNTARRGKNWPEADRIRQQLDSVGVILEDQPGGKTLWRRA
ncbi:cysteine--tRNA ligase [Peristeroidobacter agariperforans]|uniref:cysteine--tRNA ligase n=1 Tax=Peristeroidobacter agariperforans TaxID=268404 RepID=UPI00101DED10|nr:cysteine--tRNA ligase [Peristeroidobacter agariperforans]